jgi:protein TonB
MKTNDNTPSNTVSLDDIIFDGRNHAYGAFYLRKNYDKFLNISFLFAASLAIGIVAFTFINRHPAPITIPDGNIIIDGTFIVDPAIVPPPTPPPTITLGQSMIDRAIFTPPIVVTEIPTGAPGIVFPDDPFQPGTLGIPDGKVTNGVPAPIPIDTVDGTDRPFLVVEVPAEFQGNLCQWIAKHIKYPEEAASNGLDGKVYVQFVINKEGKVENAKVTRSVHPDLDKEAIRVIVASSPYWTPGRQRGTPVKQLFTMPVSFKLAGK